MKITLKLLEYHDACENSKIRFAREWPDGVEVTLKSCIRAQEISLSLYWLAQKLLPPAAFWEYSSRDAQTNAEYYLRRTQLTRATLTERTTARTNYMSQIARNLVDAFRPFEL